MKKLALRTCVACRVIKPKKELTRLVEIAHGELEIDTTGRKPGRGAYVCSKQCLKEAIKTRNLERAFHKKVKLKEVPSLVLP